MNRTLSILFVFAIFHLNAYPNGSENRSRIDLQGQWSFEIDSLNRGIDENWPLKQFSDAVTLPGTTDTNKKGILNTTKTETTHLSRVYKYVGKAWYKKEVFIPQSWAGKSISLTLERTKPSQVWIDGQSVGTNDNISTPQRYDLSNALTPGKHEITILVDNGESVPRQLLSSSHAYTESTQTNWNGIIGEIFLEAKNPVHIESLQVYPDAAKKTVTVKLSIANAHELDNRTRLELSAQAWNCTQQHKVKRAKYNLEKGKSAYSFLYSLGEDALLWSEFNPALYTLEINLKGYDSQTVNFGLREFKAQEAQFFINGQTTFLRGKHDACVFPLTAHTPMTVKEWRDYFQVCKEYGINHCRFHSWCPPRACFEAADIEGFYLQPELPFWGGLKKSETYLVDFLRKEGINIQNEYGNHASFVMFALGNELSGDLDLIKNLAETFRKTDSRHLYAFGSNNYLGSKGVLDGEDFLVTCKIGPQEGNSYRNHVRGSFSFADAYEGGYLNNTYPNSEMNFNEAVAHCPIPVISHETGQFQVYPHYPEMEKYTGVLAPVNFGIFRSRLEKAGMLEQADDFFKASGRWAAMLYKADIEMDLRTEKLGGFQLLDLQDYPGQGSAYVGILDAFMENKGLISPEEWRQFCNDVVPLFVTEKFCWTNQETLSGQIKIADYSNQSLTGKTLAWRLKEEDGKIWDQGSLKISIPQKGLSEVGTITPNIASVAQAKKLCLEIEIEGTEYKNRYPLWIYPAEEIETPDSDIYIGKELDGRMINELRKGNSVLWFPNREEYRQQTVGGLFQTDYWNYRMFKSICDRIGRPASPGTLGILTDPKHPIFSGFPTDYHTNWQWYSIIKQSYPLILDRMPSAYRPIVQVIDNVERNHKLGLIFEFNVEGGKLLVCMADLDAVKEKPEVRQLYNSMIQYMNSNQFAPKTHLRISDLTNLFTQGNNTEEIEILENISYD